MTASEMHIAVQQGLQRSGSFAFSDVLAEEIDLQLNRMQERFVKQRFDVSLADPKGFQETQKRLDDLRTIIVNDVTYTDLDGDEEATAYTASGTNWYVDFPDNYLFAINIRATTKRDSTCDDSTGVEWPCRIVKRNVLHDMLKHPFGKTRADSPIATIVGNDAYVHGDGVFVVLGVAIDYIRTPIDISNGLEYINTGTNVNCELPTHTHNEIVDMTVRHMSGIIQAPNYQTHAVETQINE